MVVRQSNQEAPGLPLKQGLGVRPRHIGEWEGRRWILLSFSEAVTQGGA